MLATYDPLTPMRFIDPAVSSAKRTLDINTLPAEVRKDCRNMAKIAYVPDGTPESERAAAKIKAANSVKTATLENMFTRQIEKQMRTNIASTMICPENPE